MQKVIIMNDIWFWGILASITGIAIMISVIKHKKSVSTIKKWHLLDFFNFDDMLRNNNHLI